MMRKLVAAAVFSSMVGCAGAALAQTAAPSVAAPPVAAPLAAGPHGRGARMIERMCGAPVKAQPSGRYEERLATRLALTDAQKTLLKSWQETRQKAREESRAALCAPKPDFSTFVGRMAYREKRLEAQLASFKATRPKIEAFYASLDDRQKAGWDEMRERRDERRQRRRHDRD